MTREQTTKARIGGAMMAAGLSPPELARVTGIKYSTLMSRIGKSGNIGTMTLRELWAIETACKRRGWEG